MSLEKTRQLGFSLGLPSHGPLLRDPQGRADELMAHHDERLTTMLEALDKGPQTAYAIARHAFPGRNDPFDYWLMLGETLAHLELLEARQQIERVYADNRVLFRRTAAPPTAVG